MTLSTRHFLGVIDGTAQFFLAQDEKGSLAIARGHEVDMAEDRGVGLSRIEEVNRIFTAFDGFDCPILTTDDASEAEASLQTFGYRAIECTERLYNYASAHACNVSQLMLICSRAAAGLLDIKEDVLS